MKKLIKMLINLIKNIIVFMVWSIIFVSFIKTLMFLIWNFDITSLHSWKTLFSFWNQGGVFKTIPDIALLLLLILSPFIYIFGYIKIKKINISKTIFFLLTSLFTRKEKDPERIVIKGIKTTQQMIEDVKSEIESIKPDKSNEAGNVRTNILKKLQEEIKK
ncbi:MAG: hypothetical protein IKC10_06930 [Alphaproteobacteria bacterium]|nr:hypothetical protein [Alphaproteobacteria bacterium]